MTSASSSAVARLLYVLRRAGEALPIYEELLGESEDASARAYRGFALPGLGRRKEALEDLRRAHDAAPDASWIAGGLAEELIRDGAQDQALEVLEGIPAHDRRPQELELLARLLFSKARNEEFLEQVALLEARGALPAYLRPCRVEALVRVGRHAEAIEEATASFSEVPEADRTALYNWRAIAHYESGQREKAAQDWSAAIDSGPPRRGSTPCSCSACRTSDASMRGSPRSTGRRRCWGRVPSCEHAAWFERWEAQVERGRRGD